MLLARTARSVGGVPFVAPARARGSRRAARRGTPCRPARGCRGSIRRPLRQDDLQVREALEDPAHQPVDAGHHRVEAVQRDEHGRRRVVRRRHQPRRAPDVHAHAGRPPRSATAHSGSQWSVWTDGRPEHGRVLGERDRLRALGDHPLELGHGEVDVVQRQDRRAEEARAVASRTTRRAGSRCTSGGTRARGRGPSR